TRISPVSVFPASTFLPTLNLIEPPWYGPVCPVVWEGWRREVSPYPDQCPLRDIRGQLRNWFSWVLSGRSGPVRDSSRCVERRAAIMRQENGRDKRAQNFSRNFA